MEPLPPRVNLCVACSSTFPFFFFFYYFHMEITSSGPPCSLRFSSFQSFDRRII